MAGAGVCAPACLQMAVTEGRSGITNAVLTAVPNQESTAKASQAIQYITGFDSWQVALLAAGCHNEYLTFWRIWSTCSFVFQSTTIEI